MEIREVDGQRGGKYLFLDLADGRTLSVSRKAGDERVWLGRTDQPKTYRGQRGGIGSIQPLLAEWRSRAALDPEAAELYAALTKLAARRELVLRDGAP